MTWVRLDETMVEHPKVAQLSDAAFRIHIDALCYANRNLTDGFVPTVIAHRRSRRRAAELVAAGVWDAAPGGYQIHDFHDYQPTKAEVIELREKRSAAGKKGADARYKVVGKSHGKSHGKRDAISMPRPGSVKDVERKEPLSTSVEIEKPRPRNEQWDGLVSVFHYSPAGSEAKLWGRLCKDLEALDATPETISEAAHRYLREMPSVVLTPTALTKHYQRLMSQPARLNGKPGTAEHTLQLAQQAREREQRA